ncbi:MAG: CAP domain-containing protein [Actinomycetia bacterium]|nr:CAP domain-containing protein [Actinomycetes bacterium]MCP4223403.1 CAP domain-containing protein [Actinomycetes bacterium]MCP5035880.1 CAP domain-containing protein [Actinomycetes bacterium]
MSQTNRLQAALGRLLATLTAVAFWLVLLVSPGATEHSIRYDPSAPHAVDAVLSGPVSSDRTIGSAGNDPVVPQGPTLIAPDPIGLDPSRGRLSSMSMVELELLRLTNELRADPAGPLRRQGPPPSCLNDPYFEIQIDPLTGLPVPVPALDLDTEISVSVAREWALQMYLDDSFVHRPSTAQQQLYTEAGISTLAWGENIAWASGYRTEDVARVHFEGWRESEIGHYCSLLTARFTRIGIGEVRVDGQSWAVQNFYHPAIVPEPVPSP